MVIKLMSPTMPLPVTAPATTLRTRRLFQQILATLAIVICVLYVLEIDLPPLISRQRFREPQALDGVGQSSSSEVVNEPQVHAFEPIVLPATYWGKDLSSEDLLAGLLPFEDKRLDDEPLSSLGTAADETYNLGTVDMERYKASMEAFIRSAFPSTLQETLLSGMLAYLGNGDGQQPVLQSKHVWQTAKDEYGAEDGMNNLLNTWKNIEAWDWALLSDEKASDYVAQQLGGSKIKALWDALPSGIHRADMLRYLLLLLEGGIYSDTDTRRLKPVDAWGGNPALWRDGEGWMTDEERLHGLAPASVIVGVEADVGNREDWHDWWPRPLQIVQWTIASAPAHPIMLSALLRITHSTAHAVDWAKQHRQEVENLVVFGDTEEARRQAKISHLDEPKNGGPVGVMGWTGPGVFTDAVLSYLRVKFGLKWTDLKDLRAPLRVGDVVILPVTGFSPGVGMFGAKTAHHVQAMVEHGFAGSWKSD